MFNACWDWNSRSVTPEDGAFITVITIIGGVRGKKFHALFFEYNKELVVVYKTGHDLVKLTKPDVHYFVSLKDQSLSGWD